MVYPFWGGEDVLHVSQLLTTQRPTVPRCFRRLCQATTELLGVNLECRTLSVHRVYNVEKSTTKVRRNFSDMLFHEPYYGRLFRSPLPNSPVPSFPEC